MRNLNLLAFLTLSIVCHVALAQSLSWQTFKKSAKTFLANGLVLVLSGQPLQQLQQATRDIEECFARTYDHEARDCIRYPHHIAAANLVVLTDYRLWTWPNDHFDDPDQLAFELMKRRFGTKVRVDQCPNESDQRKSR